MKDKKHAYLVDLRNADEDAVRVSLADKVHNSRAILRDQRKPEVGKQIWYRFNQPKSKTIWYYRRLAETFNEPAVLAELVIRGIPTMIPFHGVNEVACTPGAMSAGQIVRWLRDHSPSEAA